MNCFSQCHYRHINNKLTTNQIVSTLKQVKNPPINPPTKNLKSKTFYHLDSNNMHKANIPKVFEEQLTKKCKKSLSILKKHKKNQSLFLNAEHSKISQRQKDKYSDITSYPINHHELSKSSYNVFEKSLGINSITHNQSLCEYPPSEVIDQPTQNIKRPTSCIITNQSKAQTQKTSVFWPNSENTENSINKLSQQSETVKTSSITSPTYQYQNKKIKWPNSHISNNSNNNHNNHMNQTNQMNQTNNIWHGHNAYSGNRINNTYHQGDRNSHDTYYGNSDGIGSNVSNKNNNTYDGSKENSGSNPYKRGSSEKKSQSDFDENHIFNYATETVESGWGSSQHFSSIVESHAIYQLNNQEKRGSFSKKLQTPIYNHSDYTHNHNNSDYIHSHNHNQSDFTHNHNHNAHYSQVLGYSLNLQNTLKVTGQFPNQQSQYKCNTNLRDSRGSWLQGYRSSDKFIKDIGFLCTLKQLNFNTMKNIPSDTSVYSFIMTNYRRVSHNCLLDVYLVRPGITGLLIMIEYSEKSLSKEILIGEKRGIGYLRDIIHGLMYLEQNQVRIKFDIEMVRVVSGCVKIEWCNVHRIITNTSHIDSNNTYQLGRIAYFMIYGILPEQHHIKALQNKVNRRIPTTQKQQMSQQYYSFMEKILIYDERYRPTLNQCLLHPLFY